MAKIGGEIATPTPISGRFGRISSPEALSLILIAGLLFLRLGVLFASPLELYPDEAQYWVWSRRLGLGYFSKPPLIAWAIRATTALGSSQAEAWVRLSAPLFHALAAFALGRAGTRLYGPAAGLVAVLVYSLMPGVQLSSAVIATDAPLMAFLSLAVWAYAVFWTAPDNASGLGARRKAAAGLGVALGLAMLAKYAAVYVGLGLLLHAAASKAARRRWDGPSILLAVGLLMLILAPNLGWNLTHGLSTLVHTADAADLGQGGDQGASPTARSLFDPRQAPGFLISQFGVFGPVPFAVLLIGAARLVRFGRGPAAEEPEAATDRMLLWLALPALVIALAEAAIARANANWAAAAYAAGSVLAAGWLVRWRARRAIQATAALQGLLAAFFLLVFARPELADRLGLSNSLKRARGWSAATQAVLARAAADRLEGLGPVAIAADDRFLFNALAYYGRRTFRKPGAPPLRMWVRETKAHNEAEATEPLTTAAAGRGRVTVAAISYPEEAAADFRAARGVEHLQVVLDPKRRLALTLFTGEDFAPKPRDPRTGRPYPPPPLP